LATYWNINEAEMTAGFTVNRHEYCETLVTSQLSEVQEPWNSAERDAHFMDIISPSFSKKL